MARTSALSRTAWTSWGTTSVDTLFNAEGGNVRLYTGSTTGIVGEQGHLLEAGSPIVVPAGLAVSFMAITAGNAVVTSIAFGV